MSLLSRKGIQKAIDRDVRKRITVSLTELQVVERVIKQGGRVADHHADAYLTAMNHVDPANWYQNEPPDKTVRKIILSGKQWDERLAAIKHVQRKDMYIATAGHLYMQEMHRVPHDDNIYRVSVFPDGVDVVCFGLESVDSQLEGHYDDANHLPNWVKERLAVLNMIPATPPTNEVEGVGRRISGHVYWVFAPVASDASSSA